MITPSFSPTATERVLPRMALDFTTGVLDSRVTVARALNTATRTNSSGLVEGVNANLPRFDYDPITLAPKGLLIEEQRSNLATYSEQFNDGSWFKSNATVTANTTVAPDGTSTADKLIESTSTTSHLVLRVFNATATPYTISFYAKAAERSWCHVSGNNVATLAYFDLANGVVGSTANVTSASISAVGNGWYRCSIVCTLSAGDNYPGIGVANANNGLSYAGDGTSGIFIWGAQFEAGAFATSYIPTTTTSLTRNADAVSMTGTNFSSWYNASQGALYVEGSRFTILSFSAQAAISNGTTTNEIYVCSNIPAYGGTSAFGSITAAGVGADAAVGPTAVNTTAKMMIGYGPTNAFSVNGSAGTAITAGQPTADRLFIGARGNGSTFLNGYVRKILYYPQRLTNRELQATSK